MAVARNVILAAYGGAVRASERATRHELRSFLPLSFATFYVAGSSVFLITSLQAIVLLENYYSFAQPCLPLVRKNATCIGSRRSSTKILTGNASSARREPHQQVTSRKPVVLSRTRAGGGQASAGSKPAARLLGRLEADPRKRSAETAARIPW